MVGKDFQEERRDFIKKMALAAFTLSGTFRNISCALGAEKDQATLDEALTKAIAEESGFHYFNDNGANLHFYFLGAQILTSRRGSRLVPLDHHAGAFMIVRLPQQHLSEKLFAVENVKPDHSNAGARLSGFSYLAFKLFPESGGPAGSGSQRAGKYMPLTGEHALLDWNNPKYFQLILPERSDFTEFKAENDWPRFCAGNERMVSEDVTKTALEFYRHACEQVFGEATGKNTPASSNPVKFPVTLLEIPEGLLVTPYQAVASASSPAANGRSRKSAAAGAPPRVRFKSASQPCRRYLYSGGEGRVYRSVEEIWNTRMWFDTLGTLTNPQLRAVGYLDRYGEAYACPPAGKVPKPEECPATPTEFLPTLLDKKEIVFLTGLGGKLTSGTPDDQSRESEAWSIHTDALQFTSLGAVARYQYLNMNPPTGSSLVEYEHRISLGRDEYIKVSRLGVCSVTGQRVMHVRIGERVIQEGLCFVEFKQYLEFVTPTIVYAETIAAGNRSTVATAEDVPNRSHDRINAEASLLTPGLAPLQTTNVATWHDATLISEGQLSSTWETHTRRLPFKEAAVTLTRSPLIRSTRAVEGCTGCGTDSPAAFWPVLASDNQDLYMDFRGKDWNDDSIPFPATFLFIRKDLIDQGGTTAGQQCIRALYKDFFSDINKERRTLKISSRVCLTPDYNPVAQEDKPDGDGIPNRSNHVHVEHFEYCFGLARESGSDTKDLFNKRRFPLYPQLRNAKIYIANIQDYSPDPLPSQVEYNQDYVSYGFYGKQLSQQLSADAYLKSSDAYNKAKLIYDHTQPFLEGKSTLEPALRTGYAKIRQAFRAAGERIGGMVDPDYEIHTVGLVKQGLGFGKDINAKYRAGTALLTPQQWGQELKVFTPRDLFKKAPQLFNGISLLDVLQEVLPESDTPLNEIKEFVDQLDELLNNNPVIQSLQTARDLGLQIKTAYDAAAGALEQIKASEAFLKTAFDVLSKEYRVAEVLEMVRLRVAEFRLDVLDVSVPQIPRLDIDRATDFVVDELIARVGILNELNTTYDTARQTLTRLRLFANPPDGSVLFALIREFEEAILPPDFKNADIYGLLRLVRKNPTKEALKTADELRELVRTNTKTMVDGLSAVRVAAGKLANSHKELTDVERNQVAEERGRLVAAYNAAEQEYCRVSRDMEALVIGGIAISSLKAKKLLIVDLLAKVSKELNEAQRAGFADLEADILLVQAKLLEPYETLLRTTLPHLLGIRETAAKNYLTARDKIRDITQELGVTFFVDIEESFQKLQALVTQQTGMTRTQLRQLLNSPGRTVAEVAHAVDTAIKNREELLRSTVEEQVIAGTRKLNQLFYSPDITRAKAALVDFQKTYKQNIGQYERLVKRQVLERGESLVEQVENYIDDREKKLGEQIGPELAQLRAQIAAARQVLNLLQTVTTKETRFSWNTDKLKSLDLGIVGFNTLISPATTLNVSVVNTVSFAPAKFPAVVQGVTFAAETRITNFGISLMKSLNIYFQEVSYTTGTNRKPVFDVKIREVKFEGAFAFVQAFEKYLATLLGDAFRLKLLPTSVNVGYTLPLPAIKTPSFSFFNLTINFDFWLHFTKQPMQLGFSLGHRDNKFGITVGPYAGFGYFSIIAEPKRGITEMEIGLEFGGYYSISLGPLRGYVKLVVGMQYRKAQGVVEIAGYFLCEGRAKLWVAMITVRFYMEVRSRGGTVEGRCVAVYEIRITRFFKRAFQANYYKKLQGSTPGNNQAAQNQKARLDDLARQLAASTSGTSSLTLEQQQERVSALSERPELPYEARLLTATEWNVYMDSYQLN